MGSFLHGQQQGLIGQYGTAQLSPILSLAA